MLVGNAEYATDPEVLVEEEELVLKLCEPCAAGCQCCQARNKNGGLDILPMTSVSMFRSNTNQPKIIPPP